MRIADIRPLAEERVGFVKEENPALILRLVEEPGKILLRLADVFRHHARQIDPEHVLPCMFAEQRGRERLPRVYYSRNSSSTNLLLRENVLCGQSDSLLS